MPDWLPSVIVAVVGLFLTLALMWTRATSKAGPSGTANGVVKSAQTGCTASRGYSRRRRSAAASRCSQAMSTGTYAAGRSSASSSMRVLWLVPLPGSITHRFAPTVAAISGSQRSRIECSVRVR